MYLFSLGEKIECLNKIYFPGVYKRFDALADFLGCSKKALAHMIDMGLSSERRQKGIYFADCLEQIKDILSVVK